MTTSTITSSPPITETVTAEELEILRHFRAPLSRSSSIPKNAKTDFGFDDLLQALSANNIELSDLDCSLQEELQSSEQARPDFLALNLTMPEYYQTSFLPNRNFLIEACKQFCPHFIFEHYYTNTQMTLWTPGPRLLEQILATKLFSFEDCQRQVPFDHISSISNHIIHTESSSLLAMVSYTLHLRFPRPYVLIEA